MSSVLAIDPGYDRVGIAVFEKEVLVHSECFTPPSKEFATRLVEIQSHLDDLVQEYQPQALALETLFFNKNHKTALKVAEARGAITVTAAKHGLTVHEYSPQAVKIAVTGSGNADKASVIKMVERLVALPPLKRHDDELDAIALGLCAIHTLKYKALQSL